VYLVSKQRRSDDVISKTLLNNKYVNVFLFFIFSHISAVTTVQKIFEATRRQSHSQTETSVFYESQVYIRLQYTQWLVRYIRYSIATDIVDNVCRLPALHCVIIAHERHPDGLEFYTRLGGTFSEGKQPTQCRLLGWVCFLSKWYS